MTDAELATICKEQMLIGRTVYKSDYGLCAILEDTPLSGATFLELPGGMGFKYFRDKRVLCEYVYKDGQWLPI